MRDMALERLQGRCNVVLNQNPEQRPHGSGQLPRRGTLQRLALGAVDGRPVGLLARSVAVKGSMAASARARVPRAQAICTDRGEMRERGKQYERRERGDHLAWSERLCGMEGPALGSILADLHRRQLAVLHCNALAYKTLQFFEICPLRGM